MATPISIAEHSDVLWAITSGLFALVSFLLWRILSRMETKLDQSIEAHNQCRLTLHQTYVPRHEFDKFEAALMRDRTERWDGIRDDLKEILSAFWNHRHDSNGAVDRK